jgi:hypothetical protein
MQALVFLSMELLMTLLIVVLQVAMRPRSLNLLNIFLCWSFGLKVLTVTVTTNRCFIARTYQEASSRVLARTS